MSVRFPFSQQSLAILGTCDGRIIDVFNAVSDVIDCTILCGVRWQPQQDEAFRTGLSKVKWPHSMHNPQPGQARSRAVDAAPYPINWNDRERFVYFAGIVQGVAHQQGLRLRWGGDWDGDNELWDQTFMDLSHFELADYDPR